MQVKKYTNLIDYDADIAKAVSQLQEEVFESGAYYKSDDNYVNQPKDVDEARDRAGEHGTRSILDVYGIREQLQFGCLSPLSGAESLAYFGTDRLTLADINTIENSNEFWESMGRGEARYVVLFNSAGSQGEPVKYLIAGLAFG